MLTPITLRSPFFEERRKTCCYTYILSTLLQYLNPGHYDQHLLYVQLLLLLHPYIPCVPLLPSSFTRLKHRCAKVKKTIVLTAPVLLNFKELASSVLKRNNMSETQRPAESTVGAAATEREAFHCPA